MVDYKTKADKHEAENTKLDSKVRALTLELEEIKVNYEKAASQNEVLTKANKRYKTMTS